MPPQDEQVQEGGEDTTAGAPGGDVSPSLLDAETTQTIKLIQAETLKLEELNVVENKLNDDLMASLDPDNVPPTMPTNAQMGTGRLLQCQPQQEQSQHSVEGWHLVHKIGTPKKCYCHDCEEDRRDDDTGDSEAEDGQPRKRMSKYDEETTSILTDWFLEHKICPYPDSREKEALAKATKLSWTQISNWFTNKRKRHWTPVIAKQSRSPKDFFELCVVNPRHGDRQDSDCSASPSQSQSTSSSQSQTTPPSQSQLTPSSESEPTSSSNAPPRRWKWQRKPKSNGASGSKPKTVTKDEGWDITGSGSARVRELTRINY